MSVYDFIRNILKRWNIFAFFVAVSIVLCTVGIYFVNENTAEIVIKYLGDSAKEGKTANGEQLNPYEISSAIVVKDALERLGLDSGKANIDSICRKIKVTPIVPTSEQEKYASWIEDFSDYDEDESGKDHAVYYSVKFTSSNGLDYAKRMLNAIINEYRLFYVENYTYVNYITQLPGEAVMQYDYYETVDLLKQKINSNVEYLNNIVRTDTNYRSPVTGYSLGDIAREYSTLNRRSLSVAEQVILENGVSKNTWHLRSYLQKKALDAQVESSLNEEKAETNRGLMELYSIKNQEYLWNLNIDRDQESNQVRENADEDYYGNKIPDKATYDSLMLDYVEYRTIGANRSIDKSKYEADSQSFLEGFDDPALKQNVETMLTGICDEYNRLYALTVDTINDYNAYKSSKSISCISGVIVHNTVNSGFYYGVSIILALMLGVILCTAIELFLNKYRLKEESDSEE